jgi:hypothetical protein
MLCLQKRRLAARLKRDAGGARAWLAAEGERAIPVLLAVARGQGQQARAAAALAADVVPAACAPLAAHADPYIRVEAAFARARGGEAAGAEHLHACLDGPDDDLARHAARRLHRLGDTSPRTLLFLDRWTELSALPLSSLPADAAPRIAAFVRRRAARVDSDLRLLALTGERTKLAEVDAETAFRADAAPALRILGHLATRDALQAFVALLSADAARIRAAALDALPSAMPEEWSEVLTPIAIERQGYRVIAANPAGRRQLLAMFQNDPRQRGALLRELARYIDDDPAVFPVIAADELRNAFTAADSTKLRAAAENARARRGEWEALAAALDDAAAAAVDAEAYAPEFTEICLNDWATGEEWRQAGAKARALDAVKNDAVARAVEIWRGLLAAYPEGCRRFREVWR